jgi:hypothetical protein
MERVNIDLKKGVVKYPITKTHAAGEGEPVITDTPVVFDVTKITDATMVLDSTMVSLISDGTNYCQGAPPPPGGSWARAVADAERVFPVPREAVIVTVPSSV